MLSSSSRKLNIWHTQALLTPNSSPIWAFETIDGSLGTSAYFGASSNVEEGYVQLYLVEKSQKKRELAN